jgi:hypothetical protein
MIGRVCGFYYKGEPGEACCFFWLVAHWLARCPQNQLPPTPSSQPLAGSPTAPPLLGPRGGVEFEFGCQAPAVPLPRPGCLPSAMPAAGTSHL